MKYTEASCIVKETDISEEGNMQKKKEDNLKTVAYEYLKRELLTCAILPGESISEKDVMDHLSMGRTPVREALILLQNEQLVLMYPRSGTIAKPITREHVRDLFSLRKIIEPAVAIQSLGNLDPLALREYDRHLKDICDAGSSVPLLQFHTDDIAFHEYLVRCSGNQKIIDVCRPLFLEGLRLGMYGSAQSDQYSREETYRQHHAITEALLQENTQKISDRFIEHLNSAQIHALEMIAALDS